MTRALVIVLQLLFCGIATFALAASPDCRDGGFAAGQEAFGKAVVIGAGRLPLIADADGCPSPEARRQGRGYIVPGDAVVTGAKRGSYVCALFPGGYSSGYVPTSRLEARPTNPSPPLTAWVGRWTLVDDQIKLTIKGRALVVDGSACWPSCDPPLSERPGGPNIGELSGSAEPVGDVVVLSTGSTSDDCTAKLTLVGNFLVASDNGNCGGHNVSFSGVYWRAAPRSPR